MVLSWPAFKSKPGGMKMLEKDRENIAIFRYGIIAPILNGQVVNQKEYLAEISSKVHQVPYYGPKEYTPKGIETWLRAYRREGFEGLKPKKRSDRGEFRSLPREKEEDIISLRNDKRDLSVTLFYDYLIKKGLIMPHDASYSTVHRLLKKNDLTGKETLREPGRKRFSHDTVNILWQGDMMVGPYLKVTGKKVKTFLFAFIDDCSRIIPFSKFVFSEKFDSLKDVCKEALLRRGIPKIIYCDNGKIYRSDQLNIACASLGITLAHTKPYDAASKGKIERFFRTVRQRFLPLAKDIKTIDELNRSYWSWLEEDYHRKEHSALGMSPLDCFMSQSSKVKMVEDPLSLVPLFYKRVKRKVKHDGTISIDTKLFEVDSTLIGHQIEARYEDDYSKVLIFYDGTLVDEARIVDFATNAVAKRSLSFRDMEFKNV